jgi:hypothetical protein
LPERTLDEAFNKWWDDLEEKVQAILSTQPPTEPQRSAGDLLEEAVSNTRAILSESFKRHALFRCSHPTGRWKLSLGR